jgi:hypothetical protein
MSSRDERKEMNRINKRLDSVQVTEEYQMDEPQGSGIMGGQSRHGSPTFYKLLQEMAETHDKKSHDYASNDNPSGNYHFAGHLAKLFIHSEEDMGFVGRLGEKLYRLANLEGSEKIAQNESVEDTERDLCVITTLWMADRRDRRAKLLQKARQQAMNEQQSADISKFEQITNLIGQIQDPNFLQQLEHFTRRVKADLLHTKDASLRPD